VVELEFPGVMVLSQDELLPGSGAIIHHTEDARMV
jgi:hypothetical protein